MFWYIVVLALMVIGLGITLYEDSKFLSIDRRLTACCIRLICYVVCIMIEGAVVILDLFKGEFNIVAILMVIVLSNLIIYALKDQNKFVKLKTQNERVD